MNDYKIVKLVMVESPSLEEVEDLPCKIILLSDDTFLCRFAQLDVSYDWADPIYMSGA